ncbi:MAG TPA: hypothetical protein PK620_04940 [Denitromonas sp.]|nr:hypothetical protein [Denitromonas sp.]HQV14239.1 hypothetical protein [Denitromonas sp.]
MQRSPIASTSNSLSVDVLLAVFGFAAAVIITGLAHGFLETPLKQ